MNPYASQSKSFQKLNPHLFPRPEGWEKATAYVIEPDPPKPKPCPANLTTDEHKLNKLERRYYAWLKCLGDTWIAPQGITLKIGHDCRLTMDFGAVDAEGRLRLIDTKATNRKTGQPLVKEDAMIKMRCAARMFPWVRFLIAWEKTPGSAIWDHKEIKP